jgi:predicted restriction endonuclease
MSTDNKTPAFVPLNDTNFGQWSIQMEAHLIRKELWNMVMCETDTDGKTDVEVATIWEDWRKKRLKKKIADAYAEIVLRVEDSQLMHMRSHDPEILWDVLAQVHCARGLVMRLALWRQFLTSVKGTEEAMLAWVGCVKTMSH